MVLCINDTAGGASLENLDSRQCFNVCNSDLNVGNISPKETYIISFLEILCKENIGITNFAGYLWFQWVYSKDVLQWFQDPITYQQQYRVPLNVICVKIREVNRNRWAYGWQYQHISGRHWNRPLSQRQSGRKQVVFSHPYNSWDDSSQMICPEDWLGMCLDCSCWYPWK